MQVMVLGMKEGVGLAHCQGSTDHGGQKSGVRDWADESSGDISVTEDGEVVRAILWNILPILC